MKLNKSSMQDGWPVRQHSRLLASVIMWPLLSVLLSLPQLAEALEFECSVTGDRRFLRVDIPGEEHLCEVSVTNQADERRVMWYADNDTLFCSAKAYELRDKYTATWDFDCNTWPDRDGVDKLSARQRNILDQRLKSLINKGLEATPAFTVNAVRATSSSALDNEAGTLAIQFFLSNGDQTEIIIDDGDNWSVLTRIGSLASYIDSELPVSTALIESITDAGSLEISTLLQGESRDGSCHGNQVLQVDTEGHLSTRTPHRYVCAEVLVNSASDDAG